MPLAPNELKLSDGRVVVMRETTGRDEIAASQMLGDHFSNDGAGVQLYTKALVMMAIVTIDGKSAYQRPLKFREFMAFWGDMKTRDTQALTKKYQSLNGDGDPDSPLDESSDNASDSLQTPQPSESPLP